LVFPPVAFAVIFNPLKNKLFAPKFKEVATAAPKDALPNLWR
jgi:hypothetical protein